MKQSSPSIIIIGAGPCGLGAGWRLHELGVDTFDVYERESYVGGLATSFLDKNGFIWDVGGHVVHSHYPYFDTMFERVMQGEYLTHQRESWIWIYDRFVPYPLQNNIHRLPPAVMRECLEGLYALQKNSPSAPVTFRDWISASFGDGIAKHFLFPYNRKVWAYPLEKMSFRWVGDRVAKVDIARVERNIKLQKDDISWGPNVVFQFPIQGGTGEIWRRSARLFMNRIHLNTRVTKVDVKEKIVYFSDGSHRAYDVLLTTIPIDNFVTLAHGVDIPKSDTSLHYSSVTIVGIGIQGTVPEELKTKCWMYFPENKAPFFRATVFSNYSPNNAPKGTWSLMTETSSSRYYPLPQEDITEAVLRGARNVRLIQKKDTIVSTWKFQAVYGYPTPSMTRDGYLDVVLPALEKHRIYSRGRFGAWKYEVSNQDHTFMQGVEWVNHILHGDDEVTVYHPEIVNAKKL